MNHTQALRLRKSFGSSRRWVVKIGSALATNDGLGLNDGAIDAWAEQIVALGGNARDIVVVTSGSVADGAARLGWRERPHALNQLQAAAALGQTGLARAWDRAFEKRGKRAAQVLLTHEDLSDRTRYLNARSTLWTLLELGAVPVVNENDTVATAEISLGDNDTLAGLVSNLIDADLLVILTDQEGLMSADPRKDTNALRIAHAHVDDHQLSAIAGEGGAWGRGGMLTKLSAAKLASRSATATIIASGKDANVLGALAAGEDVGTLLYSDEEKLASRKQWLAGTIRVCGAIEVDAGARRALTERGTSLLPVGVTNVEGQFARGELVSLIGAEGQEFARGLASYSSEECAKIAGATSSEIESILGYEQEPEVIHRDNLVLL
ncbi:MAG: glutamate 5-kinase [Pseudomonadota bacterium]